MAQKNIKIGDKEFKYNLPSNPDIKKYTIKVYNETLKQISYYFVNKTEEWALVANDDDCLIMTIYGTTENGKVVNKDFYKKPNSGNIEKLSSRPDQSKGRLNTFDCEVKEMVDSPNVSYPVFILKTAQESNSHTNFYVEFLKDGDTKFIKLATSENNEIKDTTIKLQSRRSYGYKLYKVNKTDQQYVVTKATYVTLKNFITRNCQTDVEQLKEKAISYINQWGQRGAFNVKYLYRNKPSSHSTIIESKKTGIMKKYLKDNNGDPYSSIIGNISGLHLSATPKNSEGDLPDDSYFGDYRIKIFPEYLVDGCNLYFADFFCMRKIHWVTLVLTKRGSEEDRFCEHRLVKLIINFNPFFYKSGNGYKVKSRHKARRNGYISNDTSLDVEILYTEDINLTEMRLKTGLTGFKEENNITSHGGSRPEGKPKNSSCEICNLPRN